MAERKKRKRPAFENDALSGYHSSSLRSVSEAFLADTPAHKADSRAIAAEAARKDPELQQMLRRVDRDMAEYAEDKRYNRGPRRPADAPSHAQIRVRGAGGNVTRIERPGDQYRGKKKRRSRKK